MGISTEVKKGENSGKATLSEMNEKIADAEESKKLNAEQLSKNGIWSNKFPRSKLRGIHPFFWIPNRRTA